MFLIQKREEKKSKESFFDLSSSPQTDHNLKGINIIIILIGHDRQKMVAPRCRSTQSSDLKSFTSSCTTKGECNKNVFQNMEISKSSQFFSS
jgi:hypothetical protein